MASIFGMAAPEAWKLTKDKANLFTWRPAIEFSFLSVLKTGLTEQKQLGVQASAIE